MVAPTHAQLKILKLLGAGAKIGTPTKERGFYRVLLNDVVVQHVRTETMHTLASSGWIAFNARREHYELTSAGQDRVDVKAFVRAFSEAS